MTAKECVTALERGAEIIDRIADSGSTVVGFGEMGIGNSSSASVLMSTLLSISLDETVGFGAGLGSEGRLRKLNILQRAYEERQGRLLKTDPFEALRTFGGYEIAMLAGGMLRAASRRMALLIDGFICSSAALVARELVPEVLHYCFFSHLSAEPPHAALLERLGVSPLLQLQMRLGEGTGAALAYPLLQAAAGFFNEMASFEEASISTAHA